MNVLQKKNLKNYWINKMILALDIGTKLGVYFEGDIDTSTKDLIKDQGILGGNDPYMKYLKNIKDIRFSSFYKWLDYIIQEVEITQICYEEAAFQQGHAIPIYHGLIGILKAVCIEHHVPYIGIPVGTIKKTFTGKGNCNKQDMMNKCDKLNIKYDDDNGADAYATYYTYKELYKKD